MVLFSPNVVEPEFTVWRLRHWLLVVLLKLNSSLQLPLPNSLVTSDVFLNSLVKNKLPLLISISIIYLPWSLSMIIVHQQNAHDIWPWDSLPFKTGEKKEILLWNTYQESWTPAMIWRNRWDGYSTLDTVAALWDTMARLHFVNTVPVFRGVLFSRVHDLVQSYFLSHDSLALFATLNIWDL